MFKDAQNKRRQAAAKRAFDVIELARRLRLSAEIAEALYERAGGDLIRATAMAKDESLFPTSAGDLPPITAVGRQRGSD